MRLITGTFLLVFINSVKATDRRWVFHMWIDSFGNGGSVTENSHPKFNWWSNAFDMTISLNNIRQSAYQILAASTLDLLKAETPDLWDSKKVNSDKSLDVKYGGTAIKSGQIAYWALRVWDQNDNPCNYSYSFWRQEFAINQWTAQWIGAPDGFQQAALKHILTEDKATIDSHKGLKPVLYFRKIFAVQKPVMRAIIYSTAKGMYKVFLNDEDGLKHDDNLPVLLPGWTDYKKNIQYHEFNVTYNIKEHYDNTLGIMLGTGWYSGYISEAHSIYGNTEYCMLELHIEYEDGTKSIIKTDNTWRVATGPQIYSDLLHGEVFYEDRKLTGWMKHSYDDSKWSSIVSKPIEKTINLVTDSISFWSGYRPRVNIFQSWKQDDNTWIYALTKLVTGSVTINILNFAGNSRLRVRYAEAVHPNGSLYMENHGSALVTDTFVLNGKFFLF